MDFEGTSALKVVLKILTVIVVLAVVVAAIIAGVIIRSAEKRATDGPKYIDDDEISISQFKNDKNKYKFNYKEDNEYTAEWDEDKSSWKVNDSYQIENYDDILKICNALSKEHPVPLGDGTDGYRTPEDMAYEWVQHNIGYQLCLSLSFIEKAKSGLDNCMHVDINPGDQGKSVWQLIKERI